MVRRNSGKEGGLDWVLAMPNDHSPHLGPSRKPTYIGGLSRVWPIWMVASGVLVVLVAALGLPALGVAWQVWGGPRGDATTSARAFSGWALVRTVGYCGLIGVLATVLGWPAAWTLRRSGAVWIALVSVPLLLPSYLAYTGWGLLRGPGSVVGDWLARGEPARTVMANQMLAIGGLALWAWPIAALVLAMGARRIPGHLLDALALEPMSGTRRMGVLVRLMWGEVVAAAGLVALVMSGSAIPLHLAQVETYAIHLWQYMSLTTHAASVWPAALPLLAFAAAGAWGTMRAVDRPRMEMSRGSGSGEGLGGVERWARVWTIGVWMLSVAGPLAMFVLHLRNWSSLWAFWRTSGGAVMGSLSVAVVVGVLCAGICCGVFAVRTCWGRADPGARGLFVGVPVFAGLVPGVLIGAATLAFWSMPRIPEAAASGMLPVVLAHVARFGFLGALAGWMLARQESADERAARVMSAGDTLHGWWALRMVPNLGVAAGVGLASMALSIHEIESTVQLASPGSANIAQRLLDLLHYSRDEELCAACINLLTLGTAAAFAAGLLLSRLAREPEGGETPTEERGT